MEILATLVFICLVLTASSLIALGAAALLDLDEVIKWLEIGGLLLAFVTLIMVIIITVASL